MLAVQSADAPVPPPYPPPQAPRRAAAARFRIGRDLEPLARALLRVCDALAAAACGLVAEHVYLRLRGDGFHPHYGGVILGAALLCPFALQAAGAYGGKPRIPLSRTLWRGGVGSVYLFAAVLILGFLFKASATLSRVWTALWAMSFLASVLALRLSLWTGLRALSRVSVLREGVAVVGATALGAQVVERLRHGSPYPVDVLGVFDDRRAGRDDGAAEVDGSIEDLIRLGQDQALSHVILALPWTAEARVGEIVDRLKALSVDVTVCVDGAVMRLLDQPLDDLGGLPAFRLARRPLTLWSHVAKQIEDWLFGLALAIVLAPVMLAIAVAVVLDSPGPVLFRQRRHGYNNREITVYKFRTMHVQDADPAGERQAVRGDVRITRLGRCLRATSLDELPQLLNVLKGDMSLVGPRPHPVGMRTENLFGSQIVSAYPHRHRMKPGLTGLAQIHGCRGATADAPALRRRIEYDLDYIERWSLLLDLKILLLTPLRVLSRRNAF